MRHHSMRMRMTKKIDLAMRLWTMMTMMKMKTMKKKISYRLIHLTRRILDRKKLEHPIQPPPPLLLLLLPPLRLPMKQQPQLRVT